MEFSHHSGQYNAQIVAQELILIGDHYSGYRCARCLTKHWNTVFAYIREGIALDGGEKLREVFGAAQEIGNKHLGEIVSCAKEGDACKINYDDIGNMIQDVRGLRDRILANIYFNVDVVDTHDILHEDEEEHGAEPVPGHEH